ncbi:hypothetical protein Ntsu_68790 [Nocardia sp. IFM 10818]
MGVGGTHDARGIDENVQAAEEFEGRGGGGAHRFGVGDIQGDGVQPIALIGGNGLHGGGQARFVDIGGDQLRPLLEEPQGDPLPDAGTGTRD